MAWRGCCVWQWTADEARHRQGFAARITNNQVFVPRNSHRVVNAMRRDWNGVTPNWLPNARLDGAATTSRQLCLGQPLEGSQLIPWQFRPRILRKTAVSHDFLAYLAILLNGDLLPSLNCLCSAHPLLSTR